VKNVLTNVKAFDTMTPTNVITNVKTQFNANGNPAYSEHLTEKIQRKKSICKKKTASSPACSQKHASVSGFGRIMTSG